jgi:regulator of protease activity HflC (stomatin/prohibitin superfamily)
VEKNESTSTQSGLIIGLLQFAFFLVAVAVTLAFVFGVSVPPGSIGLRQITFAIPFGPKQGFADKGMAPGLHWSIPFYSKVHIIPQTIQVVDVNREGSGALEVQTTDGSSVLVDVSILARYYHDGGETELGGKKIQHGGPADLVQKLGASAIQWDNTVRRVAIDELRRALGRLSTSEFYNPQKRELAALEARDNMNEKLGKFGVGVIGAYIRRYTYSEDRIDLAIFAKNLQDQEERLNGAASKLAEAKAKSEQVAAEWDAKIQTLTVEGENKSKVIRSEGDLYQAQKVADGDLVVAEARAEVDKLKATVLAGTPGAEVYVAREMAPLVGALKGGVVTEVDPFDVDQWVKKLGVSGR